MTRLLRGLRRPVTDRWPCPDHDGACIATEVDLSGEIRYDCRAERRVAGDELALELIAAAWQPDITWTESESPDGWHRLLATTTCVHGTEQLSVGAEYMGADPDAMRAIARRGILLSRCTCGDAPWQPLLDRIDAVAAQPIRLADIRDGLRAAWTEVDSLPLADIRDVFHRFREQYFTGLTVPPFAVVADPGPGDWVDDPGVLDGPLTLRVDFREMLTEIDEAAAGVTVEDLGIRLEERVDVAIDRIDRVLNEYEQARAEQAEQWKEKP